jgi:hypothetical protein
MLLMALALVACGETSEVKEDGTLVIQGRTITAFEVDGHRCIMATGSYGVAALSCDHTYALRQGERAP